MADIRFMISAQIDTSEGGVVSIGDLRVPIVLTGLLGDISDVTHQILDTGIAVVYDVNEVSLGAIAWKFLWLESDQSSVYAELTTDDNASAGAKELYTLGLAAGIPLVLASRASYSGYAENFAAGTLDTIDRVRVQNLSGATARVRALLVR